MSTTKQQPTLFSFFKKASNENSNFNEPKDLKSVHSKEIKSKFQDNDAKHFLGCESIKLRGTDIKILDLVWAKLEGFPWWPAIVYEHPTKKIVYNKKQIHVQFFDDPPTRGWVKESFVKAYGSPASCGIPSYKDPEWISAKDEADQVISVPLEDRRALIVGHSETDVSSDGVSYLDDSETSKENIDLNISTDKKRSINGDGKNEPKNKKRRILIVSDDESEEDEYKPDKEESEDDSGSSGVDESKVSDIEPETESESGTPVKQQKKRKLPSNGFGASKPKRNISFTPKGTPKGTPNGTPNRVPAQSPSVSDSTKSKLSSFAAKEVKTPSKTKDEGDWPHMKLQWLQPDQIKDNKKRPKDDPEYDCRTLYVPEEFINKQTPAMRQWWTLKAQHFDTILFFKMGKFYELFHMDAILSIQELGLLMMKGDYAHTGFPEIAFGRYSSVLVEKGYKVGRIEQTETPDMMEKRCKTMSRPTKFDKVVNRELCQVTTLGTRVPSVFDGEATESSQSFLLAVTERVKDGPGERRHFGVCFIDSSVGIFHIGQFEDDRHNSRLRTLIAHYPPAQILLERGRLSANTLQLLKAVVPCGLLESLAPEKEFWHSSKTLSFLAESDFFKNESDMIWPHSLKQMIAEGDPLGLTAKDSYDLGLRSLGGLIWYLTMCKLEDDLLSRQKFELYVPPDQSEQLPHSTTECMFRRHMIVDGTSLRNLEIFENSSDGSTEGSLFQTLNHCSTAFGKRLLHYWCCSPLCNKTDIDARLNAIEDLRENPQVAAEVRELLKKLPDLERLLAKIHSIGLNRSQDHPDSRAIFFEMQQYSKRKVADFLSAVNGFKTTVEIIHTFKGIKDELKSSLLKSCVSLTDDGGRFYSLDKVLHFFDNAFDHSLAKKEGKIIPSKGVDKEYDEAMDRINETNKALDEYLKEQCRHFSTKVTYWGGDKKRFQLEVPDHAAKRAGDTHELTSQKKGFKRYWTEETKQLLAEMMSAEEKKENALQNIATRIFNQFDQYQKEWTSAVECIAVLDVLLSLTEFSQQGETVRPTVRNVSEGEKPFIRIIDGRHPCSIKIWSGGEYIPNSVIVGSPEGSPQDEETHSNLVLVTGPNMGGKSTLMRQTALLCLLAQMGSFVPATECSLSPVDRIFTRLGAWDRIYQGESTFFVEMAETASIIQHATQHSLVIVDELGRGTATYDGTAIAHSVVNSLVQIGCRTLFSTHYHSLVDDFVGKTGVSLGHMACMVESENDEDPSQETLTFLYKFIKGDCPKSYGFNAARLADLPESVIKSASEKAKELEKFNSRKKILRRLFTELFTKEGVFKDIINGLQDVV